MAHIKRIDDEIIPKQSDQYSSEFVASNLAYNSSLNVFAEYMNFRGTNIVCTIGPACNTLETLIEMIKAGMCIARFNFSHGAHSDHKKMMDLVREASAKTCKDRPLALALDTKGPEIRTGVVKDGAEITLVEGEKVTITTDDAFKDACTKSKIYIDYKSLCSSIKPGQIILIADGNVVLKATSIQGKEVECDIISGLTFGSRKNVCLPLVKTDLPALSEKDVADLKFGLEQKVDIIFASFIRNASNVKEIRAILNTTEQGKTIKIISKIENYEGVENIDSIIDESDGIMVARGDLGTDLPPERVVVAQKKIIASCNLKGKPVICATQMLESMIKSYRPTRAEVADVTNAVLDGADCVMLSGESANGKYPVQAVTTMQMICHAAEKMNRTKQLYENIKDSMSVMDQSEALAMAAVSMSYKLRAGGIFVLSITGKTAFLLSRFRPRCLVFCITRFEETARACRLYRNVYPIVYRGEHQSLWTDDVDARLKFGVKHAVENKICKDGSNIILLTGWKSGPGTTNCIRVSTIGAGCSIAGLK